MMTTYGVAIDDKLTLWQRLVFSVMCIAFVITILITDRVITIVWRVAKSTEATGVSSIVITRTNLFKILNIHPITGPYMMTSSNGNIFRVTGPLCGKFTGPGEFPHTGQWRGALMFSLICVWINGWVNNREAGDSRRNRGHCDVIVMMERYGVPVFICSNTALCAAIVIVALCAIQCYNGPRNIDAFVVQ